MPKFKAILNRISKDADGEVKLTLLISQAEAGEAWEIPEGKLLDVNVEVVENFIKR